MSTRIRLRRDTAANWTSNNPTLTTGEMGYETDTGKFKIGNNTNAWTALPYSITSELSEGNLNDLKDVTITSAADGDFLRWNGTAWINDAVNLSTDTIGSYVQSLVAGTGVTLANNSGEGATPTVTVDTSVVAPLASPTFTGIPAAPTAAAATNTTQVATTAFVRAEVAALVNSAGATLDTLGEIATALGNDAALSTTLTNSIALKAPLASPTFTGTPTLPPGTIATTQTAADSSTKVATTAFVTTAVGSATINSLDAIADVTIVSAVSGDLLKWNGTAWVNIAATSIDSTTKLDGGNAFTIQYNSLGPVINAGSI